MVALIARILLLAQLAIAAGVAWVLFSFFHLPAVAALLAGLALLLAVRMLITANNFRLAWRFRSETPPDHRITPWQACRLYLEEFRSTMLSSSWSMPFRAFAMHQPPAQRGLPVLLIHGYGCNSGYWRSMSRSLRMAGIAHHALSLEPVFGDIESFVPAVREAVEILCRASGSRRIVLLAHSMGGLVARAYLRTHGADQILRVITLGTPHHGTGLAAYGVGANSEQMLWVSKRHGKRGKGKRPSVNFVDECHLGGSEGAPGRWLRQLAASEDPACYALFTSIYSHQDNIIAPQTSSHLPGARNIELHGVGHVALGLNPRVQRIVIDEILAAGQKEGLPSPATTTGK